MIDTDKYEKILWTENVGEELLYDAVENLLREVKKMREEGKRLEKIIDGMTDFLESDTVYSQDVSPVTVEWKWLLGEY